MTFIQPALQVMPINGTKLHYTLAGAGAGPPLVCVHGGLADWRTWRAQLESFAPYYRVLAYSRRGHYPNPWPADYTICTPDLHAADLAALIRALDLGPVHLLANSYGGRVALALALAEPGLVRTLALGEPPAHSLLLGFPHWRGLYADFLYNAWEPAGRAFAAGDLDEGCRRFLNGAVGPGAWDALSPRAQAGLRQNAPTMAVETATPITAYLPDLDGAALRALDKPVLLIGGDGSPAMYALERAVLLDLLPQAEAAIIPGTAHLMHAQNPVAHDAAVAGWLARIA